METPRVWGQGTGGGGRSRMKNEEKYGGGAASSSPLLPSALAALVQESLLLHLDSNATFYAERLVAADASEANKLILARCYMRGGHDYRAYHLLSGATSPSARYTLATAAVAVGKYAQAERALTVPGTEKEGGEKDGGAGVAGGAAGRYLLGHIHERTGRRTSAITHYCAALAIDPLLWCAYERLCQIGADDEVEEFLNVGLTFSVGGGGGAVEGGGALLTPASAMHTNLMAPTTVDTERGEGTSGITPGNTRTTRSHSTPTSMDFVTPSPTNFITPAPSSGVQAPGGIRRDHGTGPHNVRTGSLPDAHLNRKFMDEGKMRKVSGRLFATHSSPSLRRSSRLVAAGEASATTGGHSQGRSGGGGEETENRNATPYGALLADASKARDGNLFGANDVSQEEETNRNNIPPQGLSAVWDLVKHIVNGYRHLCSYRCQMALSIFENLPHEQLNTPWILCQIGRAKCELVDYHAACEVFQKARRIAPWQLEGMEIYSTALWHLKKEVELSYLAQEVVATDRLSPQAWFVVGNCFSLQKEHELALTYFQRALQLDKYFTYAHTLCGHEFFANEDFDKGLACYRRAIACDPLHYSAWYGLGTIYFRQEKYELAEYHFRRALEINPRSSVLCCYLGMALHKLQRNSEALKLLRDAIVADPKNPLAKFERACVLMSEDKNAEALEELKELQQMAPREATIYFQMGKVFKRLDRVDRAMIHFSMALDLKPSSADVNKIKAAIEGLHAPESDDDDL